MAQNLSTAMMTVAMTDDVMTNMATASIGRQTSSCSSSGLAVSMTTSGSSTETESRLVPLRLQIRLQQTHGSLVRSVKSC